MRLAKPYAGIKIVILSQAKTKYIFNKKKKIESKLKLIKNIYFQESIESSLKTIHDIATENLGTLCMSQAFRPLKIPLNAERYEGARQKADLAAIVLQDVGVNRHGGK